ncbi:MAG: M24 family metallopeptidase C-terminal domain-containing protein, partial [Alphaproteobacteria bacterium]|nr:M24 family metallopeptidase C-terminal domain-containing protein [Alphaproteobacteria bacterium]
IENLVLVRPPERLEGGDRDMLSFETLTFAPMDRRLIDGALLSDAERHWLNRYHDQVYKLASGDLDETDRSWLRDATASIEKSAISA